MKCTDTSGGSVPTQQDSKKQLEVSEDQKSIRNQHLQAAEEKAMGKQ